MPVSVSHRHFFNEFPLVTYGLNLLKILFSNSDYISERPNFKHA